MAIMKNGWTTWVDYPLANFGINFSHEFSVDDHFSFIEEYLIISYAYSICKIDLDNEVEPFSSYLKNKWDSYGLLQPSYLPGYKFYSAQFDQPFTLLTFYEEGKLVEKEVNFIANNSFNASYISIEKKAGFYFFQSKNFKNESWLRSNLKPPITIDLFGRVKDRTFKHLELIGSIRCDIWLENVRHLKLWNDDGSDYEFAGKFDNTELAKLNTPRLNSFFRDLRNLGIKYGGKWFFETQLEVIDEHAIPVNGEVIYSQS